MLLLAPSRAWATFALVQQAASGSCSTSANTCSVTLSQNTGAGNVGVIIARGGNSSSGEISSVSTAGTWTVPSGCVLSANSRVVTCAYILSLTGGVGTITVTWNGSSPGVASFIYSEYSHTGTASLDSGSSGGLCTANDSTSGTSLSGCSLTLACSNCAIVQGIASGAAPTSITTYSNLKTSTDIGVANLLNTTSGSAPSWSFSASETGNAAAVAIAESSASTPKCTIAVLGAGKC